LLENQTTVWFAFATHEGLTAQMNCWLTKVRARVRMGVSCPSVQQDVCVLLAEMRLVKDTHEQDTKRRAAQISAGAHVRAMQLSARMLRDGQDVREYHLEAELLHEFRRHGSQFPAYTSIVAAGANSAIPHHRPTDAELRAGDFVKIDFGALVGGYHSDMTRTFVLGAAADWQREIYELVLAAQQAGVGALEPGADLAGIDGAARGIIEEAGFAEKFGHGLGHGVGLQIHEAPGINAAAAGALRTGSVVTVEPGVYLPGRGGVRIEDTVLVSGEGAESLSRFSRELTVLD
jgi:Xaa-Pro aminopeptidase